MAQDTSRALTVRVERRGRPRKDPADRLVPVSSNVHISEYDALCRIAQARGVSLAVVLRESALVYLRTRKHATGC